MSFLDALRDNPHPDAKTLLVSEPLRQRRQWLEAGWRRFEPYADSNFLTELKDESKLHSKFWELWLGLWLLGQNLKLIPQSERNFEGGPDFYFLDGDQQIWIEAVAPSCGERESPDRYPVQDEDGLLSPGRIPEDKLVLRYRTGLDGKSEKFLKYQEKDMVSEGDVCIIAISGGGLPLANILPFQPPAVVQAVFAGARSVDPISVPDMEIGDPVLRYPGKVTKSNGAKVSTAFFLDGQSNQISGILSSSPRMIEYPVEELHLIHNPEGNARLDETLFAPTLEWSWDTEVGLVPPRRRTELDELADLLRMPVGARPSYLAANGAGGVAP